MALQYSVNVRNAQLDAVETTIGPSPLLRIFTGSPPADCAAASTGTLLVEFALPSDWMANSTSGTKGATGTPWQAAAVATGTAGYFRIFNNAGTQCHLQGLVAITGGTGELILDNTSIATGQNVSIQSFTLTAANA
ncbi:MAG: hypothetical protein KatS3mg038_1566 [Candidatus Kapaibacterium sp.]|nr:MAG: hypothetical protein KatS3mg038_1566 [Candidatus Kapabacteria bacterium]